MKHIKCKVEMIPTEGPGPIVLNGAFDWKLFLNSGKQSRMETIQPHHLYFTSKEVIKEGDWILRKRECYGPRKVVRIVSPDKVYCTCENSNDEEITYVFDIQGSMKIVAATDSNLWNKKPIEETSGHFTNAPLPKIEIFFVEEYVKAQGKIDEVLLECSEICTGEIGEYDGETFEYVKQNVKLNSNGTVIIVPSPTRSYSLEEVSDILRAFDGYASAELGIAVPDGGSWFYNEYLTK